MKRIVGLALLPGLLVAGLWWSLATRGAKADLADQREQLAQVTTELGGARAAAAAAAAASPVDPVVEAARLAALTVSVPASADFGSFYAATDGIARAAGVTITANEPLPQATAVDNPASATAGTGDAAATLEGIVFHQAVNGERARLLDYIGALATLERLVRVDDVTMTSEGNGMATLALTLRIFTTAPAAPA
jgi:hypothetical protein